MNERGEPINGNRQENPNEEQEIEGIVNQNAVQDILEADRRVNEAGVDINLLVEEQRNVRPDAIENPNVGGNQNIEPHEEGAVGGVNVGGGNNRINEEANRLIEAILREDQVNEADLFGDDDEDEDFNVDDLPDLENVENGNIGPNENPNDDLDD